MNCRDNVTLNLDGVLYFKVVDPYQASYGVEDPQYAITQLAQTTMRSELGKINLDDVFKERAQLNVNIVEAINNALIEAANGSLKGVLGCTSDPVVSIDLVGNPNSSTIDLGTTQIMGSRMAKVLSWYDNEWGFSNRMVDLAKKVAALEE